MSAAKTWLPGYDGSIDFGGLAWLVLRLAVALYLVASALSRFDRARLSAVETALRLALAVLLLVKTQEIAIGALCAAALLLALHYLGPVRAAVAAVAANARTAMQRRGRTDNPCPTLPQRCISRTLPPAGFSNGAR